MWSPEAEIGPLNLCRNSHTAWNGYPMISFFRTRPDATELSVEGKISIDMGSTVGGKSLFSVILPEVIADLPGGRYALIRDPGCPADIKGC